jgi:hypothetical protein
LTYASRSGRVHDDGDAEQADSSPEIVPPIGVEVVYNHAPGQRARYEDPAVGGENPAEVRVRLKSGDEPVAAQGEDSGGNPSQAAMFSPSLPDQPRTADLRERSKGEQEQRSDNGHGRHGSWAPRGAVAARSKLGSNLLHVLAFDFVWVRPWSAAARGRPHSETTTTRTSMWAAKARRGLIEDLANALGCSVVDLTGQPYLPPDRTSVEALAALPGA